MSPLGWLLPHPLLSLTLTLVWVLLANSLDVGTLLLGILLGVTIPYLTQRFWPDRPKLRSPLRMLEYALVVLWDICVANVQVAWIILTKRNADLRPTFLVIPLDVTAPEAIATLAGTITMTPGTVSSDLSDDGRSLLVHCLHTEDPDAVVANIKRRYEARLREIFR